MNHDSTASEHYASQNLTERLKAVLHQMGPDAVPLSLDVLAPLDQFHSRGLQATKELATELVNVAGIRGTDRIVDIGSGLGGPSRYLASTYGCTVTGVDLSASFVEAATYLAERTGLDTHVSYSCGDALSLPFDAGTFDIAWTQHVAMNIAARAALYSEAFRVLRPGGHFAMFDVIAVSGEPLHYPVPWARTAASSFLKTADETRALLIEQGFHVTSWNDCTDAGIVWFADRENERARMSEAPALGLHLAMGSGFAEMAQNLARNLRERRAALVQVIAVKP